MVENVGRRSEPMGVMVWGNFGDTLRQEREFRGITLDAITRVTKISNRHLVALEQEHFDVLPGGVFNKSMVREYARVVGLDQEEWVGRYLSAHRSTGAVADEDGWMRFAENASKARGDCEPAEPPGPTAALDGHWGSAAPGSRPQLVCVELCPQEDLSGMPAHLTHSTAAVTIPPVRLTPTTAARAFAWLIPL